MYVLESMSCFVYEHWVKLRKFVYIYKKMITRVNFSGTGRHGWAPPTHRTALTWKARRCVCVRVYVRARVRDVFSIYDSNIWPRLIMVIITIIILYFIQIRHTDDFPSTSTRLVEIKDRLTYGLYPAPARRWFLCHCRRASTTFSTSFPATSSRPYSTMSSRPSTTPCTGTFRCRGNVNTR